MIRPNQIPTTSFQRARYPTGKNRFVEWVRIRHLHPKGLIFTPPLIGGDLSQQANHCRWLIRQGFDLISFNFSGHGKSSDGFSIRASLRDTEQMLQHTATLTDQEQLPLFGIASCYGAIPLLYAVHRRNPPLAGIALVNAVSRISPAAILGSFASYYLNAVRGRNGFTGFRTAVRQYADRLFPNITKGKDHFGTLRRRRANVVKTILECFMLDPLDGVCLHATPVLCIHVRQDSVLGNYGTVESYQNNLRRICPQAHFRCLAGDHYMSFFQSRHRANRMISSFITNACRYSQYSADAVLQA